MPERATPQLPLALRQPEPLGLAAFVDTGNAELTVAVRAWTRGDGEPYLFVHGGARSGKSRLAACAAGEVARHGQSTACLPLRTPGLAPEILDGLEQLDAVVIDDLDAIAGQRAWEEALFYLFNRLRAASRRLLIAARQPPAGAGVGLADLRSRLGSGASYHLRALDDAGRARLLRTGAEQRGLALGDAEVRYILRRCPRDPGWLGELLDRIDRAALAEQRRPSVRLIGRLLEQEPAAIDGGRKRGASPG